MNAEEKQAIVKHWNSNPILNALCKSELEPLLAEIDRLEAEVERQRQRLQKATELLYQANPGMIAPDCRGRWFKQKDDFLQESKP